MKTIAALLTLTMLLTACGGGGNEDATLHMRDFDIGARNYRAAIRAEMTSNLVGWAIVCKQIDGFKADELATFFKQMAATSTATPTLPQGAIAKQGQEPDPGDQAIAAKIIQDECGRTF